MRILTILLFFISISSYGQIIENYNYGKIDVRNIDDSIIILEETWNGWYLTSSKYKNVFIREAFRNDIKRGKHLKKWNVYDEGKLIPLYDNIDVINFFSKYGYEYSNTDTSKESIEFRGKEYSSTSTTITLKKNK